MYIEYFKYILEHKKNVYNACIDMSKKYKGKEKAELIFHAFVHDMSKFSPWEFIQYAKWFHGPHGIKSVNVCIEKSSKVKEGFLKGWQHHKDKNKHHWNYWSERNLLMPEKYIRQMVCDWEAMGVKFNNSAKEYYLANQNKIGMIDKTSRLYLEILLGIK